ncbi:zinc finger BED domain-containing protein RICESLEEPER 2-like [Lactuca sativa]|uniref:zinc finger BED domain-containing protein RICESLEEPER 2-like n=1 Tax=Lactuca sativa TaxID=4236 RepID=UPI001C690958|nr:zinc finger BED domain-containing protein RICESLEEPER 2-like [Lactuca sativa]
MAEMEVDGDTLPIQQSRISNASVNPSPTIDSAKKVDEGKKNEKRKQKPETSEAWAHFIRDPDDHDYSVCKHCSRRLHCPKSGETVSTFVPCKFDQTKCRYLCDRMIIIDELPFRTVEHEGFRDLVKILQQQFQIPSRTTIINYCLEIYKSEAEKLKKYFSKNRQRVSLTTDLWTSRQNLNYMCLTAHFMYKDWTIHKRIINFCPVSGHSGEIIGKYVEKNLLDWGIDKHSVLDSQHFHMRCCAHILSLVVQEGLKDVDTNITRIRSAVKYVRSELLSLKRLPKEEYWEHFRCMLPFLKGFYTSTLRISGSLYVTSNNYFHEVFGIRAMLKKKMIASDEGFKKMAAKMKEKYDKYWSNSSKINVFLFIAPILDPQYKLGYDSFIISQSFDEEKAKNLCDQVEKLLIKIPTTNSGHFEEEILIDVDDDPTTLLNNEYKRLLEENSSGTAAKCKLDWYLSEQCEPFDNKFNLRSWWKKN